MGFFKGAIDKLGKWRKLMKIAIIISIVLLLWTFVFRITVNPFVNKCIYNYRYCIVDSDGSIVEWRSDSISIDNIDDIGLLKALVNMKIAAIEMDRLVGFTDEYSIEFVSIFGVKMRYEIRYDGRIRIGNTLLTLQLTEDEMSNLFDILQKHHKHEHVLFLP